MEVSLFFISSFCVVQPEAVFSYDTEVNTTWKWRSMKLSRRNEEEREFFPATTETGLFGFQRILAFRPQVNLYCHIIQLKEKRLLGNNG